jgi:hypothetical protein
LLVCRLFKDVFDIDQDEDFASHISAADNEVQSFNEDGQGGPDKHDLHFDMKGPSSNRWNQAVIGILAKKLMQSRDALPLHMRAPERPPEYIRDLIKVKFQPCRRCWNEVQPKITARGEREERREVDDRVKSKKITNSKRQRHHTRRVTVSASL